MKNHKYMKGGNLMQSQITPVSATARATAISKYSSKRRRYEAEQSYSGNKGKQQADEREPSGEKKQESCKDGFYVAATGKPLEFQSMLKNSIQNNENMKTALKKAIELRCNAPEITAPEFMLNIN